MARVFLLREKELFVFAFLLLSIALLSSVPLFVKTTPRGLAFGGEANCPLAAANSTAFLYRDADNSVYLRRYSNASGSFSAPYLISGIGSDERLVALWDMDSDGNMDLVTSKTAWNADSVNIVLYNYSGNVSGQSCFRKGVLADRTFTVDNRNNDCGGGDLDWCRRASVTYDPSTGHFFFAVQGVTKNSAKMYELARDSYGDFRISVQVPIDLSPVIRISPSITLSHFSNDSGFTPDHLVLDYNDTGCADQKVHYYQGLSLGGFMNFQYKGIDFTILHGSSHMIFKPGKMTGNPSIHEDILYGLNALGDPGQLYRRLSRGNGNFSAEEELFDMSPQEYAPSCPIVPYRKAMLALDDFDLDHYDDIIMCMQGLLMFSKSIRGAFAIPVAIGTCTRDFTESMPLVTPHSSLPPRVDAKDARYGTDPWVGTPGEPFTFGGTMEMPWDPGDRDEQFTDVLWTIDDPTCRFGSQSWGYAGYWSSTGDVTCPTAGVRILTFMAKISSGLIGIDREPVTFSTATPPAVEAYGPYSGNVNQPIPLTGLVTDVDNVSSALWYTSDFTCTVSQGWAGDEGLRVWANGSVRCPTPGVRQLILTAYDQRNTQANDTAAVDVGGAPPPQEICDDGIDNDGDSLIDCADPDCATFPACIAGCGNGHCDGGETCATCPADCGACPPSCGDGACNGGENCTSCPLDCGSCPPPCSPVPEDCSNGVDDDCDGRIDCLDPNCFSDAACQGSSPVMFKGGSPIMLKGGSPFLFKGAGSPIVLKGSSPLVFKYASLGYNRTNAASPRANQSNTTSPAPVPNISITQKAFMSGVYTFSSFSQPQIAEIGLSAGPSGSISVFSISQAGNTTNLSLYYFGRGEVEFFEWDGSGQWAAQDLARDAVETNRYAKIGITDGRYALTENVPPPDTTKATSPLPVEEPRGSPIPWLLIPIGIILLLASLIFIAVKKFGLKLPRQRDTGRPVPPPVLPPAQPPMKKNETILVFEAKKIIENQLAKGKDMADVKLLMVGKGWDAKVVEKAAKELETKNVAMNPKT